MDKRNESIDMLRGIGMLCVMLGHVGYIPDAVLKWLIPFYVPAFFFITGYLKSEMPSKGCLKRITKRCKRLLIPYFGYSFFLLLCSVIIHHMGREEIFFALKGILYSRFCLYPDIQNANNVFYFIVSNSPLWFLTALFVVEIFYECTFYNVKSKRQIVFRSLIIFVLGLVMTHLNILLPWSIDTAMIGALFMISGYYWKLNEHKISKNSYGGGYCFLFILWWQ